MVEEQRVADCVLVVEDSRAVAGWLAGRIEDALGLRALVAGSRAAAREWLHTHAERISAAVLDLDLPDAPHGEVAGDLVERQIPSVVLTATIEDDLRDQLVAAGVCDYVLKDAPDAIDSVLRTLHRIHRNHDIGVLVVDDSRSARAYLVHLLGRWGFCCYEAGDGEQALQQIDAETDTPIRLVLCDQNMPGMDGITLIRELRRRHTTQRLGIIGVSSHGSGLLSARLLKAGADDFLTRPFLEEELSVRVNQNVDLMELLREAREGARRDPLTGLHNRLYLDEIAEQLGETARRTQQPLGALVVDLDHFKSINDRLGHFGGDTVLKRVADQLRDTVRRADVLVRSGGEEFYILTLGIDTAGARTLGERIRNGIETLELVYEGETITTSASVGVAVLEGGSVEEALKAADLAMYEAKRQGRNRVAVLPETD
ncbi:response regulator receiver modulated diguanylate cyclase [Halorhodospira halophila SL1]|uniref:diguanylate cyclase n=1 Tax=Halorhodospira halophila (strain DSM 244 / SL1) TaxID=349124 RepID=A1WZ85_HALHL|nr:diguanylate cyclase [Halorhodospira halophila]ABM62997.1 response regulator receiver modulated diguanylate cyclase [Halorhodospira halophila SL1]